MLLHKTTMLNRKKRLWYLLLQLPRQQCYLLLLFGCGDMSRIRRNSTSLDVGKSYPQFPARHRSIGVFTIRPLGPCPLAVINFLNLISAKSTPVMPISVDWRLCKPIKRYKSPSPSRHRGFVLIPEPHWGSLQRFHKPLATQRNHAGSPSSPADQHAEHFPLTDVF